MCAYGNLVLNTRTRTMAAQGATVANAIRYLSQYATIQGLPADVPVALGVVLGAARRFAEFEAVIAYGSDVLRAPEGAAAAPPTVDLVREMQRGILFLDESLSDEKSAADAVAAVDKIDKLRTEVRGLLARRDRKVDDAAVDAPLLAILEDTLGENASLRAASAALFAHAQDADRRLCATVARLYGIDALDEKAVGAAAAAGGGVEVPPRPAWLDDSVRLAHDVLLACAHEGTKAPELATKIYAALPRGAVPMEVSDGSAVPERRWTPPALPPLKRRIAANTLTDKEKNARRRLILCDIELERLHRYHLPLDPQRDFRWAAEYARSLDATAAGFTRAVTGIAQGADDEPMTSDEFKVEFTAAHAALYDRWSQELTAGTGITDLDGARAISGLAYAEKKGDTAEAMTERLAAFGRVLEHALAFWRARREEAWREVMGACFERAAVANDQPALVARAILDALPFAYGDRFLVSRAWPQRAADALDGLTGRRVDKAREVFQKANVTFANIVKQFESLERKASVQESQKITSLLTLLEKTEAGVRDPLQKWCDKLKTVVTNARDKTNTASLLAARWSDAAILVVREHLFGAAPEANAGAAPEANAAFDRIMKGPGDTAMADAKEAAVLTGVLGASLVVRNAVFETTGALEDANAICETLARAVELACSKTPSADWATALEGFNADAKWQATQAESVKACRREVSQLVSAITANDAANKLHKRTVEMLSKAMTSFAKERALAVTGAESAAALAMAKNVADSIGQPGAAGGDAAAWWKSAQLIYRTAEARCVEINAHVVSAVIAERNLPDVPAARPDTSATGSNDLSDIVRQAGERTRAYVAEEKTAVETALQVADDQGKAALKSIQAAIAEIERLRNGQLQQNRKQASKEEAAESNRAAVEALLAWGAEFQNAVEQVIRASEDESIVALVDSTLDAMKNTDDLAQEKLVEFKDTDFDSFAVQRTIKEPTASRKVACAFVLAHVADAADLAILAAAWYIGRANLPSDAPARDRIAPFNGALGLSGYRDVFREYFVGDEVFDATSPILSRTFNAFGDIIVESRRVVHPGLEEILSGRVSAPRVTSSSSMVPSSDEKKGDRMTDAVPAAGPASVLSSTDATRIVARIAEHVVALVRLAMRLREVFRADIPFVPDLMGHEDDLAGAAERIASEFMLSEGDAADRMRNNLDVISAQKLLDFAVESNSMRAPTSPETAIARDELKDLAGLYARLVDADPDHKTGDSSGARSRFAVRMTPSAVIPLLDATEDPFRKRLAFLATLMAVRPRSGALAGASAMPLLLVAEPHWKASSDTTALVKLNLERPQRSRDVVPVPAHDRKGSERAWVANLREARRWWFRILRAYMISPGFVSMDQANAVAKIERALTYTETTRRVVDEMRKESVKRAQTLYRDLEAQATEAAAFMAWAADRLVMLFRHVTARSPLAGALQKAAAENALSGPLRATDDWRLVTIKDPDTAARWRDTMKDDAKLGAVHAALPDVYALLQGVANDVDATYEDVLVQMRRRWPLVPVDEARTRADQYTAALERAQTRTRTFEMNLERAREDAKDAAADQKELVDLRTALRPLVDEYNKAEPGAARLVVGRGDPAGLVRSILASYKSARAGGAAGGGGAAGAGGGLVTRPFVYEMEVVPGSMLDRLAHWLVLVQGAAATDGVDHLVNGSMLRAQDGFVVISTEKESIEAYQAIRRATESFNARVAALRAQLGAQVVSGAVGDSADTTRELAALSDTIAQNQAVLDTKQAVASAKFAARVEAIAATVVKPGATMHDLWPWMRYLLTPTFYAQLTSLTTLCASIHPRMQRIARVGRRGSITDAAVLDDILHDALRTKISAELLAQMMRRSALEMGAVQFRAGPGAEAQSVAVSEALLVTHLRLVDHRVRVLHESFRAACETADERTASGAASRSLVPRLMGV